MQTVEHSCRYWRSVALRHNICIAPKQHTITAEMLCVTDRAGVQPRPQSMCSPGQPFMASTPLLCNYMDYYTFTDQEGWKAELD